MRLWLQWVLVVLCCQRVQWLHLILKHQWHLWVLVVLCCQWLLMRQLSHLRQWLHLTHLHQLVLLIQSVQCYQLSQMRLWHPFLPEYLMHQ
jgi:hypothetical protein